MKGAHDGTTFLKLPSSALSLWQPQKLNVCEDTRNIQCGCISTVLLARGWRDGDSGIIWCNWPTKKDLYDLRFSRRWLRRMSSSGMWRCVHSWLTDGSEESIASIFTVEKPASEGGCRLSQQSETPDIPLLPACCPSPRPYPSPLCWFQVWPTLPPSLFLYSWCFRLLAQSAVTCWRWFPSRGFFYPEDGRDTFIRNIG
jgi:hypothetical protein